MKFIEKLFIVFCFGSVVLSSHKSFSTTRVFQPAKVDLKPKYKIVVYGVARPDYSQVELHPNEVPNGKGCKEEFSKKAVFELVSLGRDRRILKRRKFDFVTTDEGKWGGVTSGKGFASLETRTFCLHLEWSPNIQTVQLFKDGKLIKERNVFRPDRP